MGVWYAGQQKILAIGVHCRDGPLHERLSDWIFFHLRNTGGEKTVEMIHVSPYWIKRIQVCEEFQGPLKKEISTYSRFIQCWRSETIFSHKRTRPIFPGGRRIATITADTAHWSQWRGQVQILDQLMSLGKTDPKLSGKGLAVGQYDVVLLSQLASVPSSRKPPRFLQQQPTCHVSDLKLLVYFSGLLLRQFSPVFHSKIWVSKKRKKSIGEEMIMM